MARLNEYNFKGVDLISSALIAGKLSKVLFPGAFIALYGGIGAGKTTFTANLAKGLDIFSVISPTFTIVCEHTGKGGMELYHFDAYRLGGENELYDIGFEDYLTRGGIIVMEWAERVSSALPSERLNIYIAIDGEVRDFLFEPLGEKYERMLREAF